MPLRVSNSVERSVTIVPSELAVIPAGTAVDVLADLSKVNGEYAGRYIQNVGANDCYYNFGVNCDPTHFNGILSKPSTVDANGYGSGQQFDASNCPQKVSVYSVGGTTISMTILKRNDLNQGSGGIL